MTARDPAVVQPESTKGFRLSPQQRRLWTLARRGSDPAFRVQAVVDLGGAIEARRLDRALAGLAASHEILRTGFHLPAGLRVPSQVIREDPEVAWTHRDLRDLGEAEGVRILDAALADALRAPFDLATGALIDARSFTRSSDRRTLQLTLSSLVADRASVHELARRLAAACCDGAGGASEPEEVLQYADLAQWLNELIEGEETEDGRSYWRDFDPESVHRVRRLLEPRAGEAELRVAAEHLDIDPAVAALLASAPDLDPAACLLAAWQVVARHHTGERRVSIGDATAGRKYGELQTAIGPLAKYLPIMVDAAPDLAFVDLAHRAEAARADARRWEEFFAWLEPPAAGSEGPDAGAGFFPFTFDAREAYSRYTVGGIEVTVRDGHQAFDRFTAELACRHEEGRWSAVLRYDASALSARRAASLAGGVEAVLAAAARRPAAVVADLEAVGESERRRLVAAGRGPEAARPGLSVLHEVGLNVERCPDAVAVSAEGETLSYGELGRRADRLARRLRLRGAGPESVIGLVTESGTARVVSVLGTLRAAGAFLPLDAANPSARLRKMVEDAAPLLVLAERALCPRLGELGVPLLAFEDALGTEPEPWVNLTPDPRPESLAYVIFTSGSSGRPKGVAIPHEAIANRIAWSRDACAMSRDDRVLHSAAFGFDFAVWELLAPLAAGGAVVLVRPGGQQDPRYLAERIRNERVTVAHFVPSMLRVFAAEPGARECCGLRLVFSGGEELPASLMGEVRDRLPGELWNQYGPTEATIDATFWPCDAASPGTAVPIGHPIANLEAHVTTPLLRLGSALVAGELALGGVGLARGYLGRPALTAEVFVPDPFGERPGARLYRTGDLVRRGEGEALVYLGRIDHQVQLRGTRIELGEIERAVVSHPGVREAVAAVRETTPGDQRLTVHFVPAGDRPPAPAELRDHLSSRIPEYMMPGDFVPLAAMPRTPSGKVDRAALPAPERGRTGAAETYVAPRGPAEELLAGAWAEVLGCERVGVHDDFFALGGHSLLAMQLVSRIRQAFGSEVPLRSVFEAPTVAQLAARVEGDAGEALQPPAIRTVPRDRPLPLSFGQQRLWFLERLDPGSPLYVIPAAVRLGGELDLGALRRAFSEVVRRHETIRARFAEGPEGPRQSFSAPGPFALCVVDLSELAAERREREARRFAVLDARRPFDLTRGPLLRATLVRLAPADHGLLISMHHVVSDGWSMGILIRDLTALYEAFAAGRPSPLPELPFQYGDYAVWQRHWLTGEVLERYLEFWRRQLDGAPTVLALPADPGRAGISWLVGGTRSGWVDRELAVRLEKVARKERATQFMVFLATVHVVLSHFSGQRDLVVGSNIANRNRGEMEAVVGFFINMLALRADLGAVSTFRELLLQVRETTLGAYSHQDLPFELLVQELGLPRDPRSTPLVQAMVDFQATPATAPESTGLAVGPLATQGDFASMGEVAKFDLSWILTRSSGGVSCELRYRKALFSELTMEHLVQRFLTCLQTIAETPEIPLETLFAALSEAGARQEDAARESFLETRSRSRPRGRKATPMSTLSSQGGTDDG